MITDKLQLRTRYGEVDKMGYVYYVNFVMYCHQARTELMRKLGVSEKVLEANKIMLPVVSFDIEYLKPVYYDELITIRTSVIKLQKSRLYFKFELKNEQGILLSTAKSTVVFADITSRIPIKTPEMVVDALNSYQKPIYM